MEQSEAENGGNVPDTVEEGRRWRVALEVEYDGTNYAGFQIQRGPATVQGELEKALEKFTGQRTKVRGASRTDAGAHAKGQVVDFITSTEHGLEKFAPALNYHLPKDINVRCAHRVEEKFNARKSAISRTYQYSIFNRNTPSPMKRLTHLWIKSALDIDKMAEAAQYLVGVHDFRSLAVGHPEDRSAVREVKRWDVERFGDTITIECEATGFLKQQIRKANGVLMEIGRGKYQTKKMKLALEGDGGSTPLLAAHGLCLISVKYANPISMADQNIRSE